MLGAGALLLTLALAFAASGCATAPPQAAMNQLGNRVEAGRDTTTPAFAHPPTGRLGIHAPYAITASADGLWFTQYSAPALLQMRYGGAFRRMDLDPDGFPERLTVARDGAVWFTDPQGNRLGRLFPNDSRADYFPLPVYRSGPASIVATPDGSIWFTEHAADQIAIFVTPGADRPTLGSHGFKEFSLPQGGGPAGIAAAPDGSLWFAENSGNRIGRIDLASNSDKAAITEFQLPVPHSHPNSVAVSSDGNVYFTELAASRIGMVTPQGQVTEMVLPVEGPALDIVAGGDGSIWITVPRSHAICRLRPGSSPGTPIDVFTLPPTAIPAFIAAGKDGNLYFTEPTGKIARFTPAGAITEFHLSN